MMNRKKVSIYQKSSIPKDRIMLLGRRQHLSDHNFVGCHFLTVLPFVGCIARQCGHALILRSFSETSMIPLSFQADQRLKLGRVLIMNRISNLLLVRHNHNPNVPSDTLSLHCNVSIV